MNIQKAAKWFGIVTLVMGILAYISAGLLPGNLFGIFSINTIYNLVYIIGGMVAIFSAASMNASKLFFRIMGGVYLALAIIEVAGHGTFLGLVPITIADIILHIVLAVFAFYCGFALQQTVTTSAM